MVTKTRVISDRVEYHVEHEDNELRRILLLDHDVTIRFDERHRARFLRLALQVEKWNEEDRRNAEDRHGSV